MRKTLTAALLALALPAHADGVVSYATEDAFDDATFAVESAIVDRGLVIDYVSHVGEMLARTKEDVGGTKDLFDAADIFLFCSAQLSRQVMEADAMNIAHCPYGVIVMDQGGAVSIGYRDLPDGMEAVESLLDEIAREAAGQ
jgi:uncharacterized protein (DUF302 family)